MTVSEAKRLAIAKYRQEKRDQLAVDVPKGKRDEFKAKAAALGISLAQLIQRAVETYGGELNHTQPAQIVDELPKLTGDEKHLVDAFNNLSPKAQKALLKFLDALQD